MRFFSPSTTFAISLLLFCSGATLAMAPTFATTKQIIAIGGGTITGSAFHVSAIRPYLLERAIQAKHLRGHS